MRRAAILAVVGWFAAAGPAWPCQVVGNLVLNCGFPVNTTVPWVIENGTCSQNTADGSSGVGNLFCSSQDTGVINVVRFTQCITVGAAASTIYGYGADAALVSGSPTCLVQISDFSNPSLDCDTNINAETTPLVPGPIGPPPQTYLQSTADTYTTGAAAVDIRIRVECTDPPGAENAFQVKFDDIFAGVDLVPVELQSFDVR